MGFEKEYFQQSNCYDGGSVAPPTVSGSGSLFPSFEPPIGVIQEMKNLGDSAKQAAKAISRFNKAAENLPVIEKEEEKPRHSTTRKVELG